MNTEPTPPPQATPRTDAAPKAAYRDAMFTELVFADFARQLERELTAARAQVEAYGAILIETVPGEHGEGIERPASPQYLKATIESLQKEWDNAESREQLLREQVTDLTAEVERLKAMEARARFELNRLRNYRGSQIIDMEAQLTDERTRSAKMVEALLAKLEADLPSIRNHAMECSAGYPPAGYEELEGEPLRIADECFNNGLDAVETKVSDWVFGQRAALTATRSSAVEPSDGVPVEVRPDTPETREWDRQAEQALAESIAKDHDRESTNVEPSAGEVTLADLESGARVILPKTKEHARAMMAVAMPFFEPATPPAPSPVPVQQPASGFIDANELLKHEAPAKSYGPEMLVVGKGYILAALQHPKVPVLPTLGVLSGELIACPFCKETDFDEIGLKHHITEGHCEKFAAIRAARPASTTSKE